MYFASPHPKVPFPDDRSDALAIARFWHQRLPSQTLVYFIQAGQGSPVKIGSAVDVPRRLATFQTAHAQELRVVCVLLGGRELERQIHRNLRSSKVRGEWFTGPEVSRLLAAAWDQQDKELNYFWRTGEAPSYRLRLDGRTQRSAREKHRAAVSAGV